MSSHSEIPTTWQKNVALWWQSTSDSTVEVCRETGESPKFSTFSHRHKNWISRTDNFPAVAHAPMVSTPNPPTLRYISHPTTTESSLMNASTPIDPPAPSPADPPPNPLPPVPPKEEPPTPHPHSPPPRTPEPSDPQKAPTRSPGGPGEVPISEPPIPGRMGHATS